MCNSYYFFFKLYHPQRDFFNLFTILAAGVCNPLKKNRDKFMRKSWCIRKDDITWIVFFHSTWKSKESKAQFWTQRSEYCGRAIYQIHQQSTSINLDPEVLPVHITHYNLYSSIEATESTRQRSRCVTTSNIVSLVQLRSFYSPILKIQEKLQTFFAPWGKLRKKEN